MADEQFQFAPVMILKPLILQNVIRAFAIADDLTYFVTFQMQIVWNINPVTDTEQRFPTAMKRVKALQWKNFPTRNDAGFMTFNEMVLVRQWTDIPGPTTNDLMVDPDGVTRQIEKVDDEPSHSVWIITLRGPTAQV